MKIIIRNTGFLNIVERITSLKEDYEKGEYSDGSVIYWIFQSPTPSAEGWYRHRLDGPAVYSLKGDIVDGYWVEGIYYSDFDEYQKAVTKFKQKENAKSNSIHGINL